MRIHTAQSFSADPRLAVQEVYDQLVAGLGGPPSWTIMTHGAAVSGEELSSAWSQLESGGSLHRLSGCGGSMGDFGFDSSGSVSVMAIRDEEGAYASACSAVGEDVEGDVMGAIDALYERSARSGEAPDLIFLSTSPGIEEEVLEAIKDEFGDGVLLIGGTAADEAIEGKWSLGDDGGSVSQGLVISTLHTATSVSAAFSSGYVPTGTTGIVTESTGRRIVSIDGKAAADVYNEWTSGALEEILADGGGMILADSSLQPIGRQLKGDDDATRYLLSHPSNVVPDGPLDLFAEFSVGDEIELMSGSIDSLVQRGSRVVEDSAQAFPDRKVAGTLVVYCAGCRLTIGDRMPEVPALIQESLGAPFLGMFTFGEQGSVEGGTSRHGNLMISAVTFYE